MNNQMKVKGNGQQPTRARGTPATKYIDVTTNASVLSTGTITSLSSVTQGVTVVQRIGDTIFWKDMYLNYTLEAINADVFTTSRIIIFQWHPNSALAVPTVNDILQSPNLTSMYDWQFSNQYTILYDKVHSQAGITAAPTISGNQAFFGRINTIPCTKKVQYSPAASTGAELIYMLFISDSLIAPFPNLSCQSRITFTDE